MHSIKIIVLLLLFITIYSVSFAGIDSRSTGANSAAIGNASVSISDLWSVYNNQAGLANLKTITTGICYENRFSVSELSVKSAAFALPVKRGTFGFSISSFGYSLYQENNYGLAFAKAFGENFSAGVKMDYFSFKLAEGYGKKSAIAAEIGIQAKLIENLSLGAHIFNISRTKLTNDNKEYLPTILRLGFNYKFSEKVFVAVETEKDIDHKAQFKTGLEYRIIKELYLRGGISTNPTLSSFGFGLNLKQFRLDFASSFHSVLGYTPQLGLLYELK